MALRKQFADQHSEYAAPRRGINLRDTYKDLGPGESPLMQNCLYDGGVRSRTGSTYLNQTSFGAYKIRGGVKFYRAAGTSQRLIAYNTNISGVTDAGVESVLTSSLTADLDTHFTPWSITDECYVANGTDTLGSVSNAGAYAAISGTNIPTPKMVMPIRDRLMAITNNGIERTNARVDDVWSSNSSWATLRPTKSGRFTCLHPYSFESTADSSGIVTGLLAFQPDAFYLITGTDFGTTVTDATASTGEDSSIVMRDPRVGTSSPYSVCTVPGVGIFWFTSDLNVFWLPTNAPNGRYVGDKLKSISGVMGLESTNTAALGQVWMQYFDRKLILGIPTGSTTYPTRQFWMDIRHLVDKPEDGPTWYGPMTGQTIGRVWVENEQGDNQLVGAEGNSSTGAYLYKMLQPSLYTDAVGTTPTSFSTVYQTYFKSFGRADLDKYLRTLHMDANPYSGTTTVDVYDLGGRIVGSITFSPDTSSRACQTLVKVSYGDGTTYGSGDTYADYEAGYAGYTALIDRSCGEYISIRVTHSGSLLRVDGLRPAANLRKREQ